MCRLGGCYGDVYQDPSEPQFFLFSVILFNHFKTSQEDQEDISLTEDGELDSESHCNASVPSASLVIDVKKDQFNATVDFQFTGVSFGVV